LPGILRRVTDIIFLDVSKGFNALRFWLSNSRAFILKMNALRFLVMSGIICPATQHSKNTGISQHMGRLEKNPEKIWVQ